MATFWPSTYPASRRPSRKAATRCANGPGDPLCRNPMTGRCGCCARTIAGRAIRAAAARLAKRLRRRTASPGGPAAVNEEARPGDEAGGGRGEKHDRVRHLLDRADPAERDP